MTVTDLGNNGGYTAAVSGSAAGSVNTLSASRLTGLAGPQSAFADVGSRVGDGVIGGVMGMESPPYFWWLLRSLSGGVLAYAPPVYQNLTESGTESTPNRIRDAVVAGALLLALPGVASVRRERVPDDPANCGAGEMPAIQVTAYSLQETDAGGTTRRDDVGYPVQLWLWTEDFVDPEKDKLALYWRWRLANYFRHNRLTGVPRVFDCKVEGGPIVQLAKTEAEPYFQVSLLNLRFIAREQRGLSA